MTELSSSLSQDSRCPPFLRPPPHILCSRCTERAVFLSTQTSGRVVSPPRTSACPCLSVFVPPFLSLPSICWKGTPLYHPCHPAPRGAPPMLIRQERPEGDAPPVVETQGSPPGPMPTLLILVSLHTAWQCVGPRPSLLSEEGRVSARSALGEGWWPGAARSLD